MADCITSEARHMDAGGSNGRWLFYFKYEDGGASTHREICVLESEMTDGNDADEAKTKAITKATADKSAWVSAKAAAESEAIDSSVIGDVTL